MKFAREKAQFLAESVASFVTFVNRQHKVNTILSDPDMLFRLKNLVEEYRLQLLASELIRVNRFVWEERESSILIGRIKKGIATIHDYVENNKDGLFIFSARLYTLTSICELDNEYF